MDKPVARLGDMHTCPMIEGPKPHVGGPVASSGAPTVFAENMPIAVVGDSVTCNGALDTILIGSSTVFACNKPVARMGDSTVHGGVIVAGAPLVLVGDPGSPPTMDKPFCEICQSDEEQNTTEE